MPILGSQITENRSGFPTSADYSSDKSGPPEKVYLTPVTKNGPFGIPVAAFDTSTNIIERRDTVFTLNAAGRAGDVGVDDNEDNVVAYGLTGGAYSNAWFNSYWFNSEWFNANWFNSALTTSGDADITEDDDTVSATGRVGISGDGDGQEDHDTVSSYGSSGNDVAGLAYIYEARDDTSITGRVIVGLGANILEDRDTVFSAGGSTSAGIPSVSVLLSWSIQGSVTGIDIYKSSDNVTYEKISSLPPLTTSYVDDVTAEAGETIYYYLTGTQTTGQKVQSSYVSVVIPRNEIVADPYFDDPGKWQEQAGSYEIIGGQYVFTNALTSQFAIQVKELTIGNEYNYTIVVSSSDITSNGSIYLGGSLNRVWRTVDGAGTFAGTFTASEIWALNIKAGSFTLPTTYGTFTLDSVSITSQ